jgi:hypothetical protein
VCLALKIVTLYTLRETQLQTVAFNFPNVRRGVALLLLFPARNADFIAEARTGYLQVTLWEIFLVEAPGPLTAAIACS